MGVPEFLREVTGLAAEIQRTRTIGALLELVSARLEALGFDVAILALTSDQRWVQYHSPRPPVSALGEALGLVGDAPAGANPMLRPTPLHDGRVFLEDFASAAQRWVGVSPGALAGLKRRAVVAPLDLAERAWGGVVFMHDELTADQADCFALLALQLGSAIERLATEERLRQRDAELELVHQLAVAGPQADTESTSRRALEHLCRTTHSDTAVLHRFEAALGEYQRVGDARGGQGRFHEAYRRFPASARYPSRTETFPAEALPVARAEAIADGYAAFAVVPLLLGGTPLGLLTLARRAAQPYGDAELHLAEVLGAQMTSLIERARLYDETRRLLRVSVEAYDELARAQAQLVRHERLSALGELAAVMAHEVRNPLGVIFNSLNTLKRLLRPTGDSEMLLAMVEEEAERLNRIVSDLLDFVRPYELARRPAPIEALVASAAAEAGQLQPGATTRIVTHCAPGLETYPVDAQLFKQALVNLIVNAVQAMPKGGVVTVSAALQPRPEGAWLEVAVRDEGPGLSPGVAEKIFQPFFTTKATGTGLGLAVVKRIAESHQGDITVTSNADRGTTFTLRLPPAVEVSRAMGLRGPAADGRTPAERQP